MQNGDTKMQVVKGRHVYAIFVDGKWFSPE